MADRAFDQMNVVPAALVIDFLHLFIIQAVNLVRGAEAGIDPIGVGDELPGLFMGHVVGDIPADFFGQRQLAI